MRSNRYEYSDQVKAIFKEIADMKKAEHKALWCLDPKNNPNKEQYPVLEEMYRLVIWTSLYKIGSLIDAFIEDGGLVFEDPTVGMVKRRKK